MMQINLLPWREQSRNEKKLIFLKRGLIFLVITLTILIIFHFSHLSLVTTQEGLSSYLQNEITKENTLINQLADKKKQKQALESQLRFIVNIYKQNYQVVQLFNELERLIPKNIYLEKINRKEKNIIIFNGSANTENEITQFVQSLVQSTILIHPILRSINSEKKDGRKYFELEMLHKG